MADLDTAIRAKLADMEADRNHCPGCEGSRDDDCSVADHKIMSAALRMVLDLHAAAERALPGEVHCGELIDWVAGGCPTVRAIAKVLGVEPQPDPEPTAEQVEVDQAFAAYRTSTGSGVEPVQSYWDRDHIAAITRDILVWWRAREGDGPWCWRCPKTAEFRRDDESLYCFECSRGHAGFYTSLAIEAKRRA